MLNDTTASLTLSIYNPGSLKKEDLVRGFIARKDLLERLVEELRHEGRSALPQHQLLIGQRGLGKTTLLRRLGYEVEDDPELKDVWIPLEFPEEQYNVASLGDFWLNCVDALSDSLDRRGDSQVSEALDARIAAVPKTGDYRATEALRILVGEADRLNRRFLLLVDNIDIVLDRLPQEQEWEFRRVLSEERRLHIVGASSRFLEAVYEHNRAFYDFFQVHELRGLEDEELLALLRHLAAESGRREVEDLLQNRKARIRALRVLTGGNPRTALLLFRILADAPEGDIQRDVEQLLDLYTPLYKARFEDLATQAQQVVDAMAIHWDPLTAAELAELLRLPVSQVSAQLKRLEDFGVVEKTAWFGEKKAAFQIAERFFNIWYLMRASRRLRRKLVWLVKFLEAWFDQEELAEKARKFLQHDPAGFGAEGFAEMALAYAQAVANRDLRRSLESAGLHAVIDEDIRQLVDFSDLPAELQDKAQRIQKLRDLRERACTYAMDWDGIDPKEFWRLLGGSPHFSLAEKERVVEQLPVLGRSGLREMYEGLQAAKAELAQRYKGIETAVSRLYEGLARGDIADVYDYEETTAVGDRWGEPALPIVAIASRLLMERLPVEELRKAESALRALAQRPEPYLRAGGWFGLGMLLEFQPDRHEEAEDAYHRGLAINPENSGAWVKLGLLLRNRPEKNGEAERAYRRAIDLDEKNATTWRRLGDLYSDDKRSQDAEAAYQRAIELDANDALTWYSRGILQIRAGEFEKAQTSFRKTVESLPGNPYTWIGLGAALAASNKFREAGQAFSRALSEPLESSEIISKVLTALADFSDSQEAFPVFVDILRRAVEVFPSDIELKSLFAGLLTRANRWEEARPVIEQLANIESEFVSPNLLRDMVKGGHAEEVLQIFEQSGADQRWRPAYEALKAAHVGTPSYLRRIAPEVRTVAEKILREIDPELFPAAEAVVSE